MQHGQWIGPDLWGYDDNWDVIGSHGWTRTSGWRRCDRQGPAGGFVSQGEPPKLRVSLL